MSDDLIPKTVREFIETNIDSIAELEALMLIRHDPKRVWTAEDLATRLYISVERTETVLTKLETLGISKVGRGGGISYKASSADLDSVVAEVVEAYSKYLIPVTNLIHTKLESKVQQFADAFRLRRKKES